MKKILLLTKYFPPEPGAGSNRAYEHAKRWANMGVEVTVLTCFPHYPDGIIPAKYRGHNYYEEEIENIKIIRTYTYATPNKGKIKRSIGFFSFMFSSILQGYKKIGKPDVIIASSPPITVGVSALILSKIKKIPFIFEVRDLWPESIVQLGEIRNKYLIKIMEYLEKKIYMNAFKIVSVTDSFVPVIESKGIKKDKISIIKNGVNLNLFIPQQKSEDIIHELKMENKFLIGYFGTFGLSHALHKVLESAIMLKKNKSIHFFFIGDGAEKENLLLFKEKNEIENATFLNTITREKLIEYYTIMDIMIVPLKNIPLFETVIPSKIFEIMAVGKPIILAVGGESKVMIRESESGIVVPPEDPKAMKEAIEKLFSNRALADFYGQNGRRFVEDNFDREKLAKNYLDLIFN